MIGSSAGRARVASEHVERKLAAILAADVAGYSRLAGAQEEHTLARSGRCAAT
jgi:adenylate cyclase